MKYSFRTRIQPKFDSKKADWIYNSSDYDVHKIGESYSVLFRKEIVAEDLNFEQLETFFEIVFKEEKDFVERYYKK